MKQTVPVVFATDKEFAPYCSTSIASLLRTRDLEREYRIYVFYDKLDSEDKCLLESMSQPGASVECVNVSGYIDKKLKFCFVYFSCMFYLHEIASSSYLHPYKVDCQPYND